MLRTKSLTALVCSGLFLVAASVHAAEVRGTVLDRDGAARSGCQIDFEGPATYRVWTDAEGTFILENPRYGTYEVTVTKGDRTKRFDEVTVDEYGLSPATLVVSW